MNRTTQCLSRMLGFRGFLAVFATVCSIISAQAVPAPLGPGGFVFPPPPGVNPTGTLLATTTSPFLSASLNGTLISRVYSGDSTSPLAGLTFTYQIILSPSSPNAVSQLTVSRFGNFLTDVSYFGDGATNTPASFISRSNEGGGIGDVMQFHFGAPGATESLFPGNTSSLLIVQTSALNFQPTTASIIDGVAVPNIASLAPLTIPEPSTAVLGIAGLVAFAVARRKK
jgi:PEP-CTERM motif